VKVVLLRGGLQIGQQFTDGSGAYSYPSLPAGEYAVREVQPAWLRYSSTPDEVTVTVVNGQTAIANFGDWNGLPTWLPLLLKVR
jgi:hypothetical protein